MSQDSCCFRPMEEIFLVAGLWNSQECVSWWDESSGETLTSLGIYFQKLGNMKLESRHAYLEKETKTRSIFRM